MSIGLRGRMEAGFSRMNDLTVIQTSQVRGLFSQRASLSRLIRTRDYVRMSSKMWTTRRIGESWLVMTTDITPSVGQLSPLQLSYPKAWKFTFFAALFIHHCTFHAIAFSYFGCWTSFCSVPFSVGLLKAACGVMITGIWVIFDTNWIPNLSLDFVLQRATTQR